MNETGDYCCSRKQYCATTYLKEYASSGWSIEELFAVLGNTTGIICLQGANFQPDLFVFWVDK